MPPVIPEIENLNRRLDNQDKILAEIKTALTSQIAVHNEMKPALDELISLWRGSKVISGVIAGLAAVGASLWAMFVWAKNHINIV